MKGSGWFLKPSPSSFVPFTFPFLSQQSVCLCVSRVRAYLTTNQQHRIPCLFKRGPLRDWPVWTRAQMEGSSAACGEGSSEEKRERAPLDESAPALRPTIMAEKPGDDESQENKGRVPLPAIKTGRSGEPVPAFSRGEVQTD
jgi:hypothetical protein